MDLKLQEAKKLENNIEVIIGMMISFSDTGNITMNHQIDKNDLF